MTKSLSACAVAAAIVLMSAMSASSQTLTANLNGGEESPAVLTGAVGTVTVSVDRVAEELTVEITAFNLSAPTTAGHIHVGPRGTAAPVVINFPIPTGRTDDLSLRFRVNASAFVPRPEIGINTMTDAIQAILLGNSYVNIHTQRNPGGEIRGQLSFPERVIATTQERSQEEK